MTDQSVGGGVDLVHVQFTDIDVDDGFVRPVRNAVAETARRQAGSDRENQVTFFEVIDCLIAANSDEQGMILWECAFGLERGDNG